MEIEMIHDLSKNYESIFNKRAKLFSEKNLKDVALTELEYKNFILENYTFLKRPVIITGEKIFIGNSKKNVLELKKHLGE
jgi:arsenate reductase